MSERIAAKRFEAGLDEGLLSLSLLYSLSYREFLLRQKMAVSNESAPSHIQAEGYPIYPATMASWEGERARYMDYRRTLGYQMYGIMGVARDDRAAPAVGGAVIFDGT